MIIEVEESLSVEVIIRYEVSALSLKFSHITRHIVNILSVVLLRINMFYCVQLVDLKLLQIRRNDS